MTQASHGTVIITGGGYGIGRSAAIGLAADGWAVLVVDRDEDRARAVAASISDEGVKAAWLAADVSDPASAETAVQVARTDLGQVRGLVNCAAVRHDGKITDVTVDQWNETVRITLGGVFNFCRAVVPEMAGAGGGSIVNVSSPSSFGRKRNIAYSAAKAAVNALSTCLAADHFSDGIRVNTVLPGLTLTGMTEGYPEERLKNAMAHTMGGRAADPDDIAQIIRFLMSPAAETFTGGLFGNVPIPVE